MIPTTQEAAVFKPGNITLQVQHHHNVRKPGTGEVLLKVLACGVCHSDTFLLSGVFPETRSYVLGHEICGTAVQLGEGVDPGKISIGKVYDVLSISPCARPSAAQPIASLNSTGLGQDGGYAQYVTVLAEQLVEVPEGLPAEVAAIAADAGVTAFNAVHNVAGIKKGTNFKVLIFGIGGLGHLAVQYAKHFGATVYACDIKPAARKLALELGATAAYDLQELTQQTNNGFTVDITIDFVSSSSTFNAAISALSGNAKQFPTSSKAVMIGVSLENLNFATANLISDGISVLTSLYGSRKDLIAALDLFASGDVRAVVHAEPLRNVNKALDDLRAFETTGRKVVVP